MIVYCIINSSYLRNLLTKCNELFVEPTLKGKIVVYISINSNKKILSTTCTCTALELSIKTGILGKMPAAIICSLFVVVGTVVLNPSYARSKYPKQLAIYLGLVFQSIISFFLSYSCY